MTWNHPIHHFNMNIKTASILNQMNFPRLMVNLVSTCHIFTYIAEVCPQTGNLSVVCYVTCMERNSLLDVIGVTEVYRCDFDTRLTLPGYHELITRVREDGSRGGVGLFIKNEINYKIRDDLSVFIPHVFESLLIEQ